MPGSGQRRRQGRPRQAPPPPIHCLSADLLLEIFLRLPSLATLVRAACSCRAWRRAVAYSSAFRRRFRALHPPPLLGLFFEAPLPVPKVPTFPAFAPTRPRDRDLAAAVDGGDFFLTSLQYRTSESLRWDIVDCCCGSVLLVNFDDASLVVVNPLTRRCGDAFDLCPEGIFDGSRGKFHPQQLDPRLVCSDDEDPMAVSFRVVLLVHDKSRVRAAVFSSDTREWSFLPWVKVPAHKRSGRRVDSSWILNRPGMEANGCLYWAYADKRYLISFDTATMEFSISKLPHCLRNCTFNLGKTANGATCIVYPDELDVGVLMHTRDDDGVERWVQDRVVPLGIEFVWVLRGGFNDVSELFVLAVRDGYAYLTTSPVYHDPQTPCWFMSLCLETMELEILFRRTFDGFAHPYIMAWPLSFVGNYGRFALEDAP